MDEGQAFIDGIKYAARLLEDEAKQSGTHAASKTWLTYAHTMLHAEAYHFEKGLDK